MAGSALSKAGSAVGNFLGRVFAPGRQLSAVVEKQGPAGFLLPISGGYVPADWPWNFWQTGADPLRGGSSAIVHACVAAYAQTVAMCPGTHWRSQEDGGRERVKNSALSRILKRPNGYQSISDFLLNLTSTLEDDGNAYALALRNARFEVSEFHLMDPAVSTARIAANGDIFYKLGGNPIVERLFPKEALAAVPARDVLHVRLQCPRHPLVGEPPLTSALLDVAASNMMVRQALAYASNQGRPSGVIETDEAFTQEQTQEVSELWKEKTTGANAGGTPVLTRGLKWKPIITTSRDAQLAEMLQIADQRIATAYRVPLALLSLLNGAGPQGSTESLMQFWVASGLGFTMNHIEEAVGRFFGLDGYPDEYLELDTAALLRSQFKDRIEGLARAVQGGVFSPNEARRTENLPDAKFGDEPRVQQQVVPLSFIDNPPKPPAPPTPPATPPADGTQPADPPGGNAPNADKLVADILAAADRFYDERTAA